MLVCQLAVMMRGRRVSLGLVMLTLRMMVRGLIMMMRRGVVMRSCELVLLVSRMVGHGITPGSFLNLELEDCLTARRPELHPEVPH
jgi:hypothetical protein